MRARYVRTEPTKRETLSAAAVSLVLATGVGVVTFYLTRLLLARDVVGQSGEAETKDVVAG